MSGYRRITATYCSEKMKKLLLAALLACPLFSHACSFAPGYERFTPAVASFESRMDENLVVLLPAPRVGAIQVERGKVAPGASCDDAGSLSLTLDWPASSAYKLKEIGFYFRVVGGKEPDRIFPREPIVGKNVGRQARFFFVWLDGAPSSQTPLKLDVEVFAVNKGLQLGAVRRFRITDAMRKPGSNAPQDAMNLAESLLFTEYRTARPKIVAAGWRPDYRRSAQEWTRFLQKSYPELRDCASNRPVCAMFFSGENGSCLKVIVSGDFPAMYRVAQVERECDNAG